MPLFVRHGLSVLAPASGTTFALMASQLPRDPHPRERLLTTLVMALAAAVATAAATLAAAAVPASALPGQALFLSVLFAAVALQGRGPRAIAVGLCGVVNVYLALFLKADPAHLPAALAGLGTALLVVVLVGLVLLPDRPAAIVARIVRALEHHGAVLVHACETLGRAPDEAAAASARLRLRRRFALLNEAILSAEEYLAATDTRAAPAVSSALMRYELALISLSAAVTAGGRPSNEEARRLRLAAARLATGRRTPSGARPAVAATPVLTILSELDAAVAGLGEAARVVQGVHDRAPVPSAPRPAPAWRPATRAAAAALLSIVGGEFVSPDRWFWAVLTAYLVFLGARSSGEMIHKGVLRVWGTVAGLVVGVLVAAALGGHRGLEAGGVLACVFGLTYVFAISQTLAVFCVTVLLGLLYSLAGLSAGAILWLRLEETAIGALAALVVDRFVFPRPTHDHVREMGGQLLGSLAEVLRLSAARLSGDEDAAPLARMRGADRLMRDLRLALRPLRASRALAWWARRPAELPVLLVCVFWVRVLVGASETLRLGAGDAFLPRVRRAADRLDELAGPRAAATGPGPGGAALPVEIGTAHIGQGRAALMQTVLINLEDALDLLAQRFDADGWRALVARRPL